MIPPSLESVVSKYVGRKYSDGDCWQLIREVCREHLGINLDSSVMTAGEAFYSVWELGDEEDPIVASRPWDVWIIIDENDYAEHVGMVVNYARMLNARNPQVCLDPLRLYKPRVLQIVRLNILDSRSDEFSAQSSGETETCG